MDQLIVDLEQLMSDWISELPSINYEEMTDYVERREQIITKMKSLTLSDSDHSLYAEPIKKILQYDGIILSKMNQLKEEALQGSNKITTGRIHKNGYEDSYTPDSIFFDKKK